MMRSKRKKRYHDNKYYFAVNAKRIEFHIEKLQLSEMILSAYQPENGNSAVDLKYEPELCLSEHRQLYHTANIR